MEKFNDSEVLAVFDGFAPQVRSRMLKLRALIFAVAKETDGVGPLEETLKWREPAYLTSKSKSGTTL